MNGWGEGREALSVGGVSRASFAVLGAGADAVHEQRKEGGVLRVEGPNENSPTNIMLASTSLGS